MSKSAKKPVVYAFIDSQNLNLGVSNDVFNKDGKLLYKGRKLDYRKFRQYLRDKLGVKEAFLFVGFIPSNGKLYERLKRCGYTLIFKEILEFENGNKKIVKGNVDTDVVLYAAAIKYNDYDKAVFVSGDGDFLSLYDYIDEKKKLLRIMVPNKFRYSRLIRKYLKRITFVSGLIGLENVRQKKTGSSGRSKSLGMPGQARDEQIIARKKGKVKGFSGKKDAGGKASRVSGKKEKK